MSERETKKENFSWQFIMMIGAIAVTGIVILLKMFELI